MLWLTDVDADHHLDGVVAEAVGVLEGVGGGLGIDRGGREGELGRHVVSRSALSWSRRSRMTPSRSAHGQISSSLRSKTSITAAATRAPATTWCARSLETPGRSAMSSTLISSSLGIHSSRSAARQDAAYEQAVAGGRRTADAGQGAERLRGGHRVVGRTAVAAACPASWAISVRIFLRSLRSALSPGGAVGEVLAAQPSGTQRAATRPRRGTRRRRRRSPASHPRCRRRRAGPRTSRTSGVRRGRSAGPRPRRAAP